MSATRLHASLIKSFKNKGLSELWLRRTTAKIEAKMHKRIERRLDALDQAAKPEDMDIPGFDFHPLKGFDPKRCTVHVNGPWCVTFAFEGTDAVDVDFEQTTEDREKMASYPAVRNPHRPPTHPGELLREDVLPATGKPKAEIARLLGISRQQLYDILDETKPVSPAMAVRLGKLFGNGAGLWSRMQNAHDTWHAEREIDVSAIPTLQRA